MKKNRLHIIIIILCNLTISCNQNRLTQNEIEILSENFVSNILSFAPLLANQKTNRGYVEIINKIVIDVRNNNKLTTTKKEVIKIVNNLISEENLNKPQKNDITRKRDYLKMNLEDFKANRMSLIHEYKFVYQSFLTLYYSDWIVNQGFGFRGIITQSLDTLLLFESTKYEIPITVDIGENNSSPFRIMSNSLQNVDKNKISIETEKYKKGVFIKRFETTGLDMHSGEEWKFKDSIKYRLIKKEN